MKRLFLAASLLACACGGRQGTIQLQIVTSPADDPFKDAAQVRVSIGTNVKTTSVVNGKFDLSVDQTPSSDTAPVLIEALDGASNIIAYGRTPAISLQPLNQGPYTVWVSRPDKVLPAFAALTAAKSDVAAVPITGLGVLYAGGRDAAGAAQATTEVFDLFTQSTIATAPMNAARAGAVGTQVSGIRAAVFGGAQAAGVGSPGMPLNTVELFDPTVGTGLWAPLSGDMVDPRSRPSIATLPSGAALVSGGVDAGGNPLATAALITTDASPRLSAIAGPMVAARAGHAVAGAKFPDGDGAILFGGLADGSTQPVAERLVGQSFSPYDVGAQANRVNATATPLADGRVLVLGGRDASGPLASGLIIAPTASPAQVTPLADALSMPREGHTATRVGNDVLVCGGATTGGTLVASCDLLDGMTGVRKETLPLATARRNHSAIELETGNVIIAGGIGGDGAPLASIEIYTPPR